jgi:DUF4097 and DUF4098 domain-containing protein YvlB
MPTFGSSGPIDVRLSLVAGDVGIVAADVAATTVEVHARSGSEEDTRAAERTTVTFADNTLEVRTPRVRRSYLDRLTGRNYDGAIAVTIRVPAGSAVHGEAVLGRLHCRGRLGECRFRTASGDIELEEAGTLALDTALGLVSVERATGRVDASTAHGDVRIGRIDGPATVRSLSGEVEIGEVTGRLQLTGVNGSVAVDRALTDVSACTTNGDVRIGEVRRGAVSMETAAGSIDVGVREGTAAHVDALSLCGEVHNGLKGTDGPGTAASTVKVHARVHLGSIEVHRAHVQDTT